MCPEVKALKVGYISPPNLLSLPSLMCLGLMIAFSCSALLGGERRNRKPHFFFSLLKSILAELRKSLQTHIHQWYGREQNRPFFSLGGGGEECQHLCWGYFLFYSCFLRDASQRCGESTVTGLQSQFFYLMSVYVDSVYQTRQFLYQILTN